MTLLCVHDAEMTPNGAGAKKRNAIAITVNLLIVVMICVRANMAAFMGIIICALNVMVLDA